jgi:Uma2 family endonuclease
MLTDIGDDRSYRLTYNQGTLEIVTPFLFHEHWNRILERLIFVLAEELNLDIFPIGSTTLKRPDLKLSAEPDSSYFIRNETTIKNRGVIDLNGNLVPDLAVEIETIDSSLNKFHIYAGLGVSELWIYSDGLLNIYQLLDGEYIQCHNSPTFAQLPLMGVPKFLEESQKIGVMGVTKNFRQWVRIMLGSNR